MAFGGSKWYDFWLADWRDVGGVYGIMNANGGMIYVGQTDSFRRRMTEHRGDKLHCMHRYSPAWVVVEVVENESWRIQREQQLIAEYNPPCNER